MKTPTQIQQEIIDYNNNLVAIAGPGSGKTFVVSTKIRNILPTLENFQGVIAISFTNKASNELKQRSLEGDLNPKGSFFGTVDRFCINEIIIPFGRHIFGTPDESNFKIVTFEESKLNKELSKKDYLNYSEEDISNICNLYKKGEVTLDIDGQLALYILDNSLSCRNYLKAKYKYIFIDEYQDSQLEQHQLFLKLKDLGLISVAVGDMNQSIYGFTGGNSKYLFELTQINDFKTFNLDTNHRSHQSIINFSNKVINVSSTPVECDECRVYGKKVEGDEKDLSEWIDSSIPKFLEKFKIENLSEVAILLRGNDSAKRVDELLHTKHRYFYSTELEKDINIWSIIFVRILNFAFNNYDTKIEVIQEFIDPETSRSKAKQISLILSELKTLINGSFSIGEVIQKFIDINNILYPEDFNNDSINLLKQVLSSRELLRLFAPPSPDEIQIMTMHKSKGLEFDLVFHLDLYNYVLPFVNEQPDGSNTYPNLVQDLNLHYVAVTRAKKCCILCTSTKRHNKYNTQLDGKYSYFFVRNNVHKLTERSPF